MIGLRRTATKGVMKMLVSDISVYQLEKIDMEHDTSSLTLKLQHESGEKSLSLIVSGIRKFEIEYPAYEVDAPFLLESLRYSLLEGNGASYLEEIGYGHLNSDGSVQSFYKDKGKLYRMRLVGDVNLSLVFENIVVT